MYTIASFLLTTCSTLVHIKIIKTGPNMRLIYNFEKEIKVDNMYTIVNFVVRPVELESRPMYI
jgi:hypothetical protein